MEMRVSNHHKCATMNCNTVFEMPHEVRMYLKSLSHKVRFSLSLFLLHHDTCPPHCSKNQHILHVTAQILHLPFPLFTTTGKYLSLSPIIFSTQFAFHLTHVHKTNMSYQKKKV